MPKPQDKREKPFVFVLMPFSKDFDDIYQFGIEQACAEVGATCARVDKEQFLGNILDRTYENIGDADVLVAEMSGQKPNVFYEAGYAHGKGKPVILLTATPDDIPFNLKHYPHIVHGMKAGELKPQLAAKLRWCLDNPAEAAKPFAADNKEQDLMSEHILGYLNLHNFNSVGFERARERIDPSYTDEAMWQLIRQRPKVFRPATMSGGLPGIGRAGVKSRKRSGNANA